MRRGQPQRWARSSSRPPYAPQSSKVRRTAKAKLIAAKPERAEHPFSGGIEDRPARRRIGSERRFAFTLTLLFVTASLPPSRGAKALSAWTTRAQLPGDRSRRWIER
jgi:hypothetical protein